MGGLSELFKLIFGPSDIPSPTNTPMNRTKPSAAPKFDTSVASTVTDTTTVLSSPANAKVVGVARPMSPLSVPPQYRVTRVKSPAPAPAVTVLANGTSRPEIPYWQLRKWRQVADGLFLGFFKTRLGSCHGVIRWYGPWDACVYVHDVPQAILNGPHGACFVEVKPSKYQVHFAECPADVNSAIFYLETLLQEAFSNEHRS